MIGSVHLGHDFVWKFDVMIDHNNELIRVRNLYMKYVKRSVKRITTDESKIPMFLDRKVKLQPRQAVVAIFGMRILNPLNDCKQGCLLLNTNSQNSVVLGRSFSVLQNTVCGCINENTGHNGFNPGFVNEDGL